MFYTKKKSLKFLIPIFTILSISLINFLIFHINNQNHFKNSIITKINDFIPNIKFNNQANETSSGKTTSNLNSANGILEIPKINLKQELPAKDSYDNDVNKNIFVIKESIYPKSKKISHLILAAHSGYNKVAYFKRLPELEKGDNVYFYYQNKKYIYKITDFYEIEKTGKMVFKSSQIDDITLITCLKGTKKQIIYQGILTYTSNI